MGWRDWWKGAAPADMEPEFTEMNWDDVLAQYDVVEVHTETVTPYVVVAEREQSPLKLAEPTGMPNLTELGSSSPSPFVSFSRQEYNQQLQGLKGLEQYDRMRKSDGTVRGTLRLVKTPVLAGRWFVEPASQSTRDVNAAEFVWKQLTELMSISWSQILQESLLMADFGYYMFEKVWEERVVDGKERLIWSKLAPRHPMDVKKWEYDKQGGPNGVKMFSPTSSHWLYDDIYIPVDKLLVMTFDREAGNIEGISVLRSAYKHWYFKEQLYKIDAIQKERHGIGVPVIKLPPGFNNTDKQLANEMGRNLRTNERAHIVLPPNWELIFAKLEGHVVNAIESIKMHDSAIRENVIATFAGRESGSGNEEDQDMFLKATRFIADTVCDTFNMYAIPQLVEYNFSRVGMPKLRVRRIGEQADWRTLSFAVRNLIGSGVIVPDDKLEAHLREEMDLPMADPATARKTATPQNPGDSGDGVEDDGSGPDPNRKQNATQNRPGQPRQTPKPPVGNGTANAGKDGSGGK